MRATKFILVSLLICVILLLWLFVGRGFCDAVADPYSSENTDSIGAWYDESWQAGGYYRLERMGSTDNFRYEYTATPTTASNPTFTEEGSLANKKTGDPVDGTPPPHKHPYADAASGASLPQDIVVTEWKVTGHVHFSAAQ